MTSCLTGGGRTYALDLEIIKSPSHSTRTSHSSSSPSSTLSEAGNSPLAISTRKARTPRKRPNQTYNEAAALLSTAYPNIFSTKNLTNPGKSKFIKPQQAFFDDSSELLLPFRVIHDSGFLLRQPPIQDKPPRFSFGFDRKVSDFVDKPCPSNGEVDFQGNSMELSNEFNEDFEAESILDEEIEEGTIDSIMGNLRVDNQADDESSGVGQVHSSNNHNNNNNNYWYGNPMGLGFGGKLEFGLGMRALRHVDEGNWWSFPIVDVLQICPKFNHGINIDRSSSKKAQSEKKKKRVEKEKPVAVELNSPKVPVSGELRLKLQYDDVLSAWSNRGSPFLDESLCSDVQGDDVSARLAQIDLFSESGVREASVQRYKEKRRTRLFSKKIRYQVRKVNADRRPRMKGRFVRRPNHNGTSAQDEKGRKKVILCDL